MMYFHKVIISTVLGIIEGIIEFLPISSTGHIIIISHLLKIEHFQIKILGSFIQLGSALAILCYFYKKILKTFNFRVNIIKKKQKTYMPFSLYFLQYF